MIAKVEVERFNLISSRPFDMILAAIIGAIGHPDNGCVREKDNGCSDIFRVRKYSSRRVGKDGPNALHGTGPRRRYKESDGSR